MQFPTHDVARITVVEAYDRLVAEGFLTSRPGSGLFVAATESAGVVADYVYGAGMHWQGGRGGFPCDGSGSLNKWNVIGELKAATPLGVAAAKRGRQTPRYRRSQSSGRAGGGNQRVVRRDRPFFAQS